MADKPKVIIDRELSWIDFNLRVLSEAEKQCNPLFERLNFVSIFESNFDEFFRVRVGSAFDDLLVSKGGMADKIRRRIEDIFRSAAKAVGSLDRVFDQLMEDGAGVFRRITADNITNEEYAALKAHFEREIAPIAAPFIVEKKNPFPFFENGAVVAGVTLSPKNQKSVKFGFIPLTKSMPACVFVPSAGVLSFMLIEDLLLMFADKIFHKFEIRERMVFSIIRNADIDEDEGLYDYDVDFRRTMSKLVEVRKKLAPVELKYSGHKCPKILDHLKDVLCLSRMQMIRQTTPLSLAFAGELRRRLPADRYPAYYYPPLVPQYPRGLKKGGIMRHIQKKDLLLAYPFDDVTALTDLLHEAAVSPDVRSIDISLYRVAGDSKVVRELMYAAENGKKVSCMVELRARFDEENNIDWSRRLEDAGCRVYYGLAHYKVHCKLIHIAMKSGRDIVQVGTGNFNEKTARLYTDLALFTANESIVREVRAVFNALKGGRFVRRRKLMLIAPLCLKPQLLAMMDEQIALAKSGERAEMTFKFNALTDKELINKLIEASCAGVKIKMLIRGICCLIPGVPGVTENIEVRSIVGRFLEHSRIYVFGAGRNKKYYISSADFMTRNTDRRVEAAVPVTDYTARRRLAKILRLGFADTTNARELKSDGEYHNVEQKGAPCNMQEQLFADAYKPSVRARRKTDGEEKSCED